MRGLGSLPTNTPEEPKNCISSSAMGTETGGTAPAYPTLTNGACAGELGSVKRKTAFGSISEAGCRWLERSFSFKQTCRQQEWPYFEMLRGSISNHLQGLPQDLSMYEPIMQVAQQMRKELGGEDSAQATSSSELQKTA